MIRTMAQNDIQIDCGRLIEKLELLGKITRSFSTAKHNI